MHSPKNESSHQEFCFNIQPHNSLPSESDERISMNKFKSLENANFSNLIDVKSYCTLRKKSLESDKSKVLNSNSSLNLDSQISTVKFPEVPNHNYWLDEYDKNDSSCFLKKGNNENVISGKNIFNSLDFLNKNLLEDNINMRRNSIEDMNGATSNLVEIPQLERFNLAAADADCFDVQDDSKNFETNDIQKVEECLQELDEYLENIESKSINRNYNNDSNNFLDSRNSGSFGQTWKRKSMRKTFILPLPDQIIDQETQQNVNSTSNNSTSLNYRSSPIPNFFFKSDNETTNNSDLLNQLGCASSLEANCGINENSPKKNCNQLENLNNLDIADNLLSNSILHNNELDSSRLYDNRPRQLGRRAEGHPRIMSIQMDNMNSGFARITLSHRPMSAPATDHSLNNNLTEAPLTCSSVSNVNYCSTNTFVGSDTSMESSRIPSPISIVSSTATTSSLGSNPEQETVDEPSLDPENSQLPNVEMNSFWPHGCSRILALFCCTFGLFNISRFAILTMNYGGNFVIQFLILSIIFGIPMLWLQMCLGSKILGGPASMWKISPICRGIGICLCLAQFIIAIYSTISLAWILVYLRDSFVRKNENYKWQEKFFIFRKDSNVTTNLTETVPDYFNGIVLQRWQLGLSRKFETGGVRFQLAFNLAVIWTIVFIILCRGCKSFGKIVFGLTSLPMILFFVITCKFLYIIDFSSAQNIFSDFEDFFVNSKTWSAAAQETFLTWVLLGPSVISISSRSAENQCSKTILRRDAILVVILTLFGLCLATIFGYSCLQILKNYDYIYLPGSFEHKEIYTSIYSLKSPISRSLISLPVKWTSHYSSVLGESFRRIRIVESGYQPLRLITEIFPSIVAVADNKISSVYTVLGFTAFLFFGIGQMCAMWKPISGALGSSSSSVLLSCVTGLLLGIPFATEIGISGIYYLDLLIGGAWWIPLVWTGQIFGIFLIRGRPYNGDLLVKDLKMNTSMSAFLALSWNVLLPIGLVTLSVIEYKSSTTNQFFYWRGKAYFPIWARKLGSLIQIAFLILVPVVAIIQIYRYLSSGPSDILDRIQLLYRPTESPLPHRRPPVSHSTSNANTNPVPIPSPVVNAQTDSPPKYTPPPSYTTATGSRLAKMLRQSIRRSVRRILGEPNHQRLQDEPSLPPDYILSEYSSNPSGSNRCDEGNEIIPRSSYSNQFIRTLSLERHRWRRSQPRVPSTSAFTAFDVAQVLSPSRFKFSRSAENLVFNIAPLGNTFPVSTIDNQEVDKNGENTSVI